MADPSAVLGLVVSILTLYSMLQKVCSTPQLKRWLIKELLLLSLGVSATQKERSGRMILNGGVEEATAFKQSVIDECNMTAVAVSFGPRLNIKTANVMQSRELS